MKRLLLLVLALSIGMAIHAQDAFYITAGATAVKHLVIPSAELGVQFNKNKLGFNVQTYDVNRRSIEWLPANLEDRYNIWRENHNPNRMWVGNVRYTRIVPIVRNISFLPNTTVGAIINDGKSDLRLAFTGGAGISVNLTQKLSLQTITQFPILENRKGKFKYPSVQNGLLLSYNLF